MGLSGMWLVVAIGVGVLLLSLLFAGTISKLRVYTVSDMLKLRYGSKSAAGASSIVMMLYTMFLVVTSTGAYATVLHVLVQCVTDLNTILSPFLPFSANAVDLVFGGSGEVQPMPELRVTDDLDGGPGYPILTGDYTTAAPWARRPVVAGTPVAKPTPVFTKLDPALVDEELARLGADG